MESFTIKFKPLVWHITRQEKEESSTPWGHYMLHLWTGLSPDEDSWLPFWIANGPQTLVELSVNDTSLGESQLPYASRYNLVSKARAIEICQHHHNDLATAELLDL